MSLADLGAAVAGLARKASAAALSASAASASGEGGGPANGAAGAADGAGAAALLAAAAASNGGRISNSGGAAAAAQQHPPQHAPAYAAPDRVPQRPSQLLIGGPGSLCAGLPRYARQPPIESVVFGWGVSEDGQLGLDTAKDVAVPKVVEALLGVQFSGRSFGRTPLVAGSRNTLAIDAQGQVWSFGWNARGTLGHGHRDKERKPQRVGALKGIRIVQVAIGGWHCLALSDKGSVFAWGGNEYGQCGVSLGTRDIVEPIPVSLGLPSLRVRSVACGGMHSLALLEDGSVWQWGENWGDFSMRPTRTPRPVPGAVGVAAVCCGAFHNMALTAGGRVLTWGINDYGQLGHGSTTYCTAPRAVLDMDHVVVADIAAGGWHSCALSSAGEVYVWGRGEYGRLGLGDRSGSSKLRPQKVRGLESHVVVQVAAGGTHTMALTASARLFVWGRGAFGRLGLPEGERDCYHPVEGFLPGGPERWRVAAIAAGGRHSLVLAIPARESGPTMVGAGAERGEGIYAGGGSSEDYDVADGYSEPSLCDKFFAYDAAGGQHLHGAASPQRRASGAGGGGNGYGYGAAAAGGGPALHPLPALGALDAGGSGAAVELRPQEVVVPSGGRGGGGESGGEEEEGEGGGARTPTLAPPPPPPAAPHGPARSLSAASAASNGTSAPLAPPAALPPVVTSYGNRAAGGGGGGGSGAASPSANRPPSPRASYFAANASGAAAPTSPAAAAAEVASYYSAATAGPAAGVLAGMLPGSADPWGSVPGGALASSLDSDSDMARYTSAAAAALGLGSLAAAGRPGSTGGGSQAGGSECGGGGAGSMRSDGFRPVFAMGGDEEDEATQAAEAAEAAAEEAADRGGGGAGSGGEGGDELGPGADADDGDTDEEQALYDAGPARSRSPLPRPRSPSMSMAVAPHSPRRHPGGGMPLSNMSRGAAGGLGAAGALLSGSPGGRAFGGAYGSPRVNSMLGGGGPQ